jgi:hypothetical protein
MALFSVGCNPEGNGAGLALLWRLLRARLRRLETPPVRAYAPEAADQP